LERRTRPLGGPPGSGACSPCTGRGLASRRVTTTLVGSYPTLSPLPPASPESRRRWRSPFCATFRRLSPPGISPASCPSVSGLSSGASARDHPACREIVAPCSLTDRRLHITIVVGTRGARRDATR